jgi:hypothetical protein
MKWIPQGDQRTAFADKPPAPVHDDIIIAKLRPGQVGQWGRTSSSAVALPALR